MAKDKNQFSDQFTSYHPPINSSLAFGSIIIILFFSIFCIWGIFFELESAAIAPGNVAVESENKSIQHLEGGIVQKIYVKEGSHVKAGNPLIKLDETQAKAKLKLLRRQFYSLSAQAARLTAEQNQEINIQFPKKILAKAENDSVVKSIIKGQEKIFKARKTALKDKNKILQQRIDQLKKQIQSYQSQVKSFNTQLKLLREEIEAVAYLEAKKIVDRPRLLALKREEARLVGNRDERLALIAKAEQQIGETKTSIIGLMNEHFNEVVQELRKTQNELNDVIQHEMAAKDILKRTLITAPYSGKVVNLNVHAKKSVIMEGKNLLDIVPDKESLIIKVQINPLDIDVVSAGMTARVELSAFKQRTTPQLEGVVTHVSADAHQDKRTGTRYYLAKVQINLVELKKLKHIKLTPGMPAQVMIITDKRTFFNYLITPIKDSFKRAFRET